MVGRRFRLGFLPLAIVVVAAPARAEDPKGPWRSKDVLEARLAQACDAVEKACGAKFVNRPMVRISTPDEIEDVVREDVAPLLEAVGYGDQVDAMVGLLSKALAAKYDDRDHTIHVVPDNVDRLAKEVREPSLP